MGYVHSNPSWFRKGHDPRKAEPVRKHPGNFNAHLVLENVLPIFCSEVLRTHEMRHMEECEQRTGRIMMNLRTLSFDGMILGYFGSPRQWNGEFGSFMMFGEMARHPSVKARHLDSFFGCKISPDLSITASKSMTWWAVSSSCWWQTAGEIVGCDSCLILLVLDFCRARWIRCPFEVGTCPFLVAPKWRMTTSENR